MIKEIVKDEFMDCREVQKICMAKGISKYGVREMKRSEGIKTVEVANDKGEKLWLWFDPQQVWEKYNA